jgi:hypothetical protein
MVDRSLEIWKVVLTNRVLVTAKSSIQYGNRKARPERHLAFEMFCHPRESFDETA